MGDMARETHHIYVALEDQQATYQVSMFKLKGKIAKKSISILIDHGSTHSCVTLRIIESCHLKRKKHAKS